jgi:hypothetical protein
MYQLRRPPQVQKTIISEPEAPVKNNDEEEALPLKEHQEERPLGTEGDH